MTNNEYPVFETTHKLACEVLTVMHQVQEVLTIREVATLLRIGINKAYQLAKHPDFPCLKIGNALLVPRQPLLEWLTSQACEHNEIAI